jgi:hypothetical protein
MDVDSGTTNAETVEWTSHPWSDDSPRRRVMLVVLLAGASLVAAVAFGATAGFISAAVLFASLSRYFIPVTYVLASDGVSARYLGGHRRYPWSRFRRVALRPEGVFLGTFDGPRRLDAFRGLYLRCPHKRKAVFAYARAGVVVGPSPAGDRAPPGVAAAAGTDSGR